MLGCLVTATVFTVCEVPVYGMTQHITNTMFERRGSFNTRFGILLQVK